MVNSGVSGKGWHNENLRHSQAKRFGKASGGKVSAPKSVSGKKTKKLKSNMKTSMWNEIDHASWKKKNKKSLLEEKKDLVKHYDDLTTSDLQGTVEALAKTHGVDEDDLLNEIIVAHNYKTSKLQNEYLENKNINRHIATKQERKKDRYLSKDSYVYNKPNVVSVSNKNISVKEAVAYHNSEAKKSLKKNEYAKYRYHTREAVKINQKARLLSMKKK